MKLSFASAILPIALLAACQREAPAQPETGTAALPASAFAKAVVKPWPLPIDAVAAQPDLVVTHDGLLLSWVEPQGEGHALKFATYVNGAWSAAREIARGDDWFVNWADTPHVAVTPDGAWWAHWLQKSASATYAYDVVLVRSSDRGRTWSAPLRVNDDGKAAEHGFVSLWPASYDRLGIAWLDGRESSGEGHAAHEGHGGAMTLRAAEFDANLQRQDEARVDAMTCDCCQTDATATSRGPLLVFRDRSPEEIRDIYATRRQDGAWRAPQAVHADGWTMPGCPVNGPSVAAQRNAVLVGWYTEAGGTPTVKWARSNDAGDTFSAPVTLDAGDAVQGRVDVAFGGDTAWAVWLREDGAGQSLQLARYTADLARELQRVEIAKLQGRGRGTGFPQLMAGGDRLHLVWTDIVAGKPRLHAVVITR